MAAVESALAVRLRDQALDAREALLVWAVALPGDAEVLARRQNALAGQPPVATLLRRSSARLGLRAERGSLVRVDLVGDTVGLDRVCGLLPRLGVCFVRGARARPEDSRDVLAWPLDPVSATPVNSGDASGAKQEQTTPTDYSVPISPSR